MMWFKRLFLLAFVLALAPRAIGEPLLVGNFTGGDLTGWQQKRFKGESNYVLVEQEAKQVLALSSNNSASALYKKVNIDLDKTPYLHWSWRVDVSPGDLNPLTQAGDDYAVRVYVVKRGLFPWQAKALNYVWLNKARLQDKAGLSHWANPFSTNAIMIGLAATKKGQWQSYKIDVQADFKRYFNLEISELDGVAIMTDSDNIGRQTQAYLGDVYFSKE